MSAKINFNEAKRRLMKEVQVLLVIELSCAIVIALTFLIRFLHLKMIAYFSLSELLRTVNINFLIYRIIIESSIFLCFFGYFIYWAVKFFILAVKRFKRKA